MKHNRTNTHVFNFRLFLEALKRLRVIGLGTAILSLTVSVLVPVTTWIQRNDNLSKDVYSMETQGLCIPAGLVVFLAPLFFAVLFSFLQKRKESDFFHAIPYTRTCVYVSFVSAALAFIWIIQLACGVVSGILWSMVPRLAADIGGMFAYVAISMLAAAMLSAFMMLALTVSGTRGSCTLLFLLFAGFVRVVCAIFLGCMETIYFIDTNEMWDVSALAPQWLLPLNIVYYWMSFQDSCLILYSLSNILYSLVVTVGLFTLAGLLYNRRKSEMAGNPAPGVKTQALFRIMFTTVAALLIPLLLIAGEINSALMLVLVVGVLLIYFLYELITTKRPKNLLRIFPGLGIVAGICVAFLLSFVGYRAFLVNERITSNEIKWISMESNGFVGGTYQDRLSDTLRTDDPELLKAIADRYAVSQKYERDGVPQPGYDDDYYSRTDVTVRLKGGRTLYLRISVDDTTREKMQDRFASLEEVKDILYLLPKESEVQSAGLSLGNRYDVYLGKEDKFTTLYDTFCAEFETLTDQQKAEVMAPALYTQSSYGKESYYDYDYGINTSNNGNMRLVVSGYVNGRRFSNDYIIIEEMTETRRLAVYLWGENNLDQSYVGSDNYYTSGTPKEVLTVLADYADDPKVTDDEAYVKGLISLWNASGDKQLFTGETAYVLYAKDYDRLAAILSEAWAVTSSTKETEFKLTGDTYCIGLYTEWSDKTQLSLGIYGVFELTPEQLDELLDILYIES